MPFVKTETLRDRFERLIDRRGPDECWLWKASTTRQGYGQISEDHHKVFKAHRLAWEYAHGESIPSGMSACHTCDVRRCCNPKHLFLGTTQDNLADRNRKGRQAKGERQGLAKLTEEQVREIRKDGRSLRLVALDFNVSTFAIHCIRRGKTWKHF